MVAYLEYLEQNWIECFSWKEPTRIIQPDHFRADQRLNHVIMGIVQINNNFLYANKLGALNPC